MTSAKTPAPKGGEVERDTRTIYERIADAYIEIAATDFAKSEKVSGGYSYIPVKQILEIVRKAHSRNGIFTIFGAPEYDASQNEKRYSQVRKNYKGNDTTWQIANGHVDVRIYGRMGDFIDMTVPCEAQDNSDKLTNLLMTNAQRSLYRTMYSIDEGGAEDPEAFNIALEEKNALTEEHMEETRNKKRAQAKSDPFFSKKPTEAGPTDRPISVLVDCLVRWTDIETVHSTIAACKSAYGPHIDKWGPEEVRSTYLRCVNEFKANGGIPE